MAPEGGATGGLMAAVGLGAEAADARIRSEGLAATVVACDNSAVNVTLAGAGAWHPKLCFFGSWARLECQLLQPS